MEDVQGTEVVSVDVNQPGVAPYRHEPAVKRSDTGSSLAVDSVDPVVAVLITWCTYWHLF